MSTPDLRKLAEADWRDDPTAHVWTKCCCQQAGDGHCWLCGYQRTDHLLSMPVAPARALLTPEAPHD